MYYIVSVTRFVRGALSNDVAIWIVVRACIKTTTDRARQNGVWRRKKDRKRPVIVGRRMYNVPVVNNFRTMRETHCRSGALDLLK